MLCPVAPKSGYRPIHKLYTDLVQVKRIALFILAINLTAQHPPLEDRAVQAAMAVPVSTLEAGLPNQTLAQWMKSTVGPGTPIRWAANDCGEESDDPPVDRGRDFPLCVEAVGKLPEGRSAVVNVLLGTYQKGMVGAPQLFSIYLGNGSNFERLEKLRALPARFKAGR